MTYQDTLNWMFSQLPMYQRQGKSAYKTDLFNTILLLDHLKKPHHDFKSIHVAGTNGKGSTSHMLASILQESGYRVGLYTSPHLKDFRERIKVNGKEVNKHYVINFIKDHKCFFENNQLSFFEMTVGMAFNYFSKEKVDISIIEVGLGGRLDSTNIITPEVAVITNIGLDHTQFLGDTLESIAFEKGGIIKEGIPVVIGETQKETQLVFQTLAKKNNSHIIFADSVGITKTYKTDLLGNYQKKNIKTVLQTIKQLENKGFIISKKNIKNGLCHVVRNTGLLGRWQILNNKPKVICDTGHNRAGLKDVINQLLKEQYYDLHIVFGVVKDKDISSIVDLLPKEATYYFCKPDISRGMDAEVLKLLLNAYELRGESYSSVNEAYAKALKQANTNDLIFIGGSTFVVAEII